MSFFIIRKISLIELFGRFICNAEKLETKTASIEHLVSEKIKIKIVEYEVGPCSRKGRMVSASTPSF